MNEEQSASLLAGISEDADEEAKKILDQAEKSAASRLESCRAQIRGMEKEIHDRIDGQAAGIEQSTKAAISVETRKINLKARKKMYTQVIRAAEEECRKLIGTPEYQEILAGWITEAALGMGSGDFSVNASKKELSLISDSLLRKAEEMADTLGGIKVHLSLSSDPPLQNQGILIEDKEKRTAFNNQVKTRILRYQREIQRRIAEKLSLD